MKGDGAITVLISGRGSNLKALIQHQSGYRVAHVISDRADAAGLFIAREQGIQTTVVTRERFSTLSDFKSGVLEAVQASKPDVVALAGFMVVLQPAFIEAFLGRLVNIHPSLLPLFPGLHTHERALEARAAHHGCTVHYVDAGVDTGPLIAQAVVEVLPTDTPSSLSARVLTHEHLMYPWVLSRIVSGDISLEGRTVRYSARANKEAAEKGLSLFSQ
jgi:phosphoribosylglycinamide formyltransferase-1